MDNLRKKFSSPTKGLEAERQSVFHAPLVSWDAASVANSEKSILDHLEKLNQFCGTGTNTVNHLWGLLQGTRYSDLSQRYKDRFNEIDEATKAEVAQVTTEVKTALGKVTPRGGSTDDATPTHESDTDIKLVACTLARIMQLHCQFLITASEILEPVSRQILSEGLLSDASSTLTTASQSPSAAGQLNKPSPASSSQESGAQDANQASVDPSEQGSAGKTNPGESKKSSGGPQAVGSPSGLRKISSFFSKFGRSGAGSSEVLPQSSFYISIPKDEVSENNDKENKVDDAAVGTGGKASAAKAGEGDESTATAAMNKMHISETPSEKVQLAVPGVPPNGRLATQEELDSVIDLLSGGQRSPMQVIPENVPSHHVSKAIGQHFSNAQPMFSMVPDPPSVLMAPDAGFYRGQPPHQHRRSDGMIGESFPREHKTNTWPYRPHQRSSAGDLGTGSMSHTMCGYEGVVSDVEYSRYLASVKAMKPGHPATTLGGPGPWSNTDPGLNKSWPMHLYNNDGTENANRNWSTVGDSSSCSDESSTGDTPWMMGLDLMGAVNDKRRHSSGEESFPAGPGNKVAEARPRSVENLLETKLTNTWPPKQPWAKAGPGGHPDDVGVGDGLPLQTAHPPLTMQWSDPLTNRSLSTWGAGTMPSFSNQRLQSFPSLVHGGSAEVLHSNPLHDRTFTSRK